jgi:predicted RNase H-like nuclease
MLRRATSALYRTGSIIGCMPRIIRRQPPAYWTAGVDGCPGGWIVVLAAVAADTGRPVEMVSRLCTAFVDVLALPERPVSIAVDMPIGLLDRAVPGGRACDREARALLGRPRASSVFSPPTRKALAARCYAEVAALNGAGMSKEAFNILPKIREVDASIDPGWQDTVVEAHPELAFLGFAGRPMLHNKRTPGGRRERMWLLRQILGKVCVDPVRVRAEHGLSRVGVDDVLDACALAIVAGRRWRKVAQRLPARPPPLDAKGLRMEIWY